MIFNLVKRNKGFTLIETMVAIAILAVSITLPLTIAEKSLVTAREAKNQTVSFYLAQDALEYIKLMRERNIYAKVAWDKGFTSCINKNGETKLCTVDTSTSSGDLTICTEPDPKNLSKKICPKLKFQGWFSDEGGFGYDPSWKDTIFTRDIFIEESATNKNEIKVLVTVRWTTFPLPERSFTIENNLTSWEMIKIK